VLLAGGYAAYKLTQKDTERVEEYTGKPAEDLTEEELVAAMERRPTLKMRVRTLLPVPRKVNRPILTSWSGSGSCGMKASSPTRSLRLRRKSFWGCRCRVPTLLNLGLIMERFASMLSMPERLCVPLPARSSIIEELIRTRTIFPEART
jgi:hypothetical protein